MVFGKKDSDLETLEKQKAVIEQKYEQALKEKKDADAAARLAQRQLEQKQRYAEDQQKRFSTDKNLTYRIFAFVVYVSKHGMDYDKIVYSKALKRNTTVRATYSIPELLAKFKIPIDLFDGDLLDD